MPVDDPVEPGILDKRRRERVAVCLGTHVVFKDHVRKLFSVGGVLEKQAVSGTAFTLPAQSFAIFAKE